MKKFCWLFQIDSVLKWIDRGWKLATLLNFLVFLQQGRYQSVLERLLGIRAVFPHPQGVRQVCGAAMLFLPVEEYDSVHNCTFEYPRTLHPNLYRQVMNVYSLTTKSLEASYSFTDPSNCALSVMAMVLYFTGGVRVHGQRAVVARLCCKYHNVCSPHMPK